MPPKSHGHCSGNRHTPEYKAWAAMKQRCLNPNDAGYKDYGGRGITVCDRWRESFELFLADMGPRPSSKHSLDRIDNEKGYCPDNCRWTVIATQLSNTRRNNWVTWNGVKDTLTNWSKKTGINKTTLLFRKRNGWPVEKMMTVKPVRGWRNHGYATKAA